MKLQEYMDTLQKFVKDNPEAMELDVYTTDGNVAKEVWSYPELIVWDYGDYETKESFTREQEYEFEEDREDFKPNAVSIN